jgi:hypothetical protein
MGKQIQKVLPLVRIFRLLFSVQQQHRVSQVHHQPASTTQLKTSLLHNRTGALFYVILAFLSLKR